MYLKLEEIIMNSIAFIKNGGGNGIVSNFLKRAAGFTTIPVELNRVVYAGTVAADISSML